MVRITVLLLSFSISVLSCSKKMNEEASIVVSRLSLEEKIGQILLFALPGTEMNRDNRAIISKYKPGGVIFFGYNITGSGKLAYFTDSLQKFAFEKYGIPMFITTDQEGGRVRRINEGVEAFPGNLASGISEEYDAVEKMGEIQGLQLRMLGINMNLAPVLDVNNNPENPVINTRSFGSDPEVVSKMGERYIKGLAMGRCISVAKHFPGHGDTASDSHYELPVIKHDLAHLEKNELIPFRNAIRNDVESIMTAHILYPKIVDKKVSATLSPFFLTELLRKKYKFSGIIMTDDLEMNAVSMRLKLGRAAVDSFKAGSDIILVSTYGKNINEIYTSFLKAVHDGEISMERLDESVRRIIELKLRYAIAGFDKKSGKLLSGSFVPEKEKLKLLEGASALNGKISGSALYFRGNTDSLDRKGEVRRLYFTGNRDFITSINLKKGDRIIGSAGELRKALSSKTAAESKTQVVYQFFNLNRNFLSSINKIAKSNGAELIALYTGNPFIFTGVDRNLPVLFTFSPTEMSLKQAAQVFNGILKPKTKINCNLGIGRGGM